MRDFDVKCLKYDGVGNGRLDYVNGADTMQANNIEG